MHAYRKCKIMQKLYLGFSKFGPVWFQVEHDPIYSAW